MLDRFKRRSHRLEYIDTGNYTAAEYESCIGELQLVNRWMGDAHSLRTTLFREIEAQSLTDFSVLDVGAGSGELLRVTAGWARQTNRQVSAVGLELNERSAESINEESQRFEEIRSVRGDALELPFPDAQFDYVICSLFTHHFVDGQVIQILREMSRVAKRRIFVIDLHRHPIAYFLYTTIGKLVLHNRLLRHDGALSILRSFKSDELLELAQRAGLRDVCVERRFPYRLVLSAAAPIQSSKMNSAPPWSAAA
ncbi:MAG TPA: methyltransferase domain-containing protein [Pyrinomonadaceae bacterium]|jgi:ubiquinone/menaquinone biosynthesis C-methylase UbiE|nr:methyltransferase domain-containing protein [Pyrinomonadaceae bacterium]